MSERGLSTSEIVYYDHLRHEEGRELLYGFLHMIGGRYEMYEMPKGLLVRERIEYDTHVFDLAYQLENQHHLVCNLLCEIFERKDNHLVIDVERFLEVFLIELSSFLDAVNEMPIGIPLSLECTPSIDDILRFMWLYYDEESTNRPDICEYISTHNGRSYLSDYNIIMNRRQAEDNLIKRVKYTTRLNKRLAEAEYREGKKRAKKGSGFKTGKELEQEEEES